MLKDAKLLKTLLLWVIMHEYLETHVRSELSEDAVSSETCGLGIYNFLKRL